MATVTVFTSERTAEIEATSIVSGSINAAGHLILNRHDGTPIDMGAVSGVQLDQGTTYAKADVFSYVGDTDPGAVPDGSVWFDTTGPTGPFASETQQGLVELATTAEAAAGTDTQRAVTPAGFLAAYNAIPGNKVQILAANTNTESATPGAYPLGISVMSLTTGSGWSINSGFGSVTTYRAETDRTVQHAFSNPGGTGTPRMWQRQYHTSNNGGGWTAWSQVNLMYTLTPANFAQTTNAFSGYPSGWSRLYYTTANSTNWDFAGSAGEVLTYVDGSDFAKQTYVSHGHSSTTAPAVWTRTANAANGWSAWAKQIPDTGGWFSYTPTWTSQGSVQPSLGNATVNCKYIKQGRRVDVLFEITFGSTTNFGASPTTGDNWQFSLPVTAAGTTSTIGFVELAQSIDNTCMARARLYSSTGFRLGICTGKVDGAAIANRGDADSLSPWTWLSGDTLRGTLTYESAA